MSLILRLAKQAWLGDPVLEDLIEQGLGDQADYYLLLWADILKVGDVDQLRAGLAIMKQIADRRGEIDRLYDDLRRTVHSGIAAKRRPMQMLEMMAQRDRTLAQTAEALGISLHTANQHIASARKSLFCKTNAGAVYAAVKEGLI